MILVKLFAKPYFYKQLNTYNIIIYIFQEIIISGIFSQKFFPIDIVSSNE